LVSSTSSSANQSHGNEVEPYLDRACDDPLGTQHTRGLSAAFRVAFKMDLEPALPNA